MIKTKKGFTLIELLIALSIMSIVLALGFSMYLFTVKNFETQSVNANNQSNVRYALSYISKEIRRADTVVISGNKIKINSTVEYKLNNNAIMKNENILVSDIETFIVLETGNKITLKITSLPNTNGQRVTFSSEIYIRE